MHALAQAQAAAGHDVVVLTAAESATPSKPSLPAQDARANGVRVIRVRSDAPSLTFTSDMLAWVALLQHALVRAGLRLQGQWTPDVIHGHDWMVTHAGLALREASCTPFTATIHATEWGRHQGCLDTPQAAAIHEIENSLAYASDELIVCSYHMRAEVASVFGVPSVDIRVIPNGIDPGAWQPDAAAAARMRQQWGAPGRLLVYSGRVEYEKGVHTLLAAFRAVHDRHPECQLVVCGQGSQERELHQRAAELGLVGCVRFTGWLPEDDLHALVTAADLAVIPSIYEPFGLVALEAAALGTPLVVSATGGLAEFAGPRQERALTFRPGDAGDLARVVLAALADPAAQLARAGIAHDSLRTEYSWPLIAARVVEVYRQAGAPDPRSPSEDIAASWNAFQLAHLSVPSDSAR